LKGLHYRRKKLAKGIIWKQGGLNKGSPLGRKGFREIKKVFGNPIGRAGFREVLTHKEGSWHLFSWKPL